MSPGSFENNFIYYNSFTNHIYLVYKYKKNLALNNL